MQDEEPVEPNLHPFKIGKPGILPMGSLHVPLISAMLGGIHIVNVLFLRPSSLLFLSILWRLGKRVVKTVSVWTCEGSGRRVWLFVFGLGDCSCFSGLSWSISLNLPTYMNGTGNTGERLHRDNVFWRRRDNRLEEGRLREVHSLSV